MHGCALTTAGAVKCWGLQGACPYCSSQYAPVDIAGLASGIVSVAAGGSHTCALTTSGGVKCWGANSSGQLGDGTTSVLRNEAADVTGLGGAIVALAAGGAHTCALTSGGDVKCWGANDAGQVGAGGAQTILSPVDVPGVSGVLAISAGSFHTCAIVPGGAVRCWGSDNWGQLGGGSLLRDVPGLPGPAMAIAAGALHTCAIVAGGEVWCWGANSGGQLGTGASGRFQSFRVPVAVRNFRFQDITFAPIANRDLNAAPFTLSATASSGLDVTLFSSTPDVCTVSGFLVTLRAIGICRISANQEGDGDYLAAARRDQSFLVSGETGAAAPRLGNISTRTRVAGGEDVLIGGFIIGGSTPKTVVVRARGPSLAAAGVANAMPDPMLTLYSGQAVIARNNDWSAWWEFRGSSDEQKVLELEATGFAPGDERDAALLMTLPPGSYTAVVTPAVANGVATPPGVGIVEVFELDRPDAPLLNVSSRGPVASGGDVLIGGFVIQGTAPQTVVVRARGPSLAPFGIANALANPALLLVRSSDQSAIGSNDDWQTAGNAAALAASGFAPSNPLEAALLVTLPPGAYTAIVSGVGGTGVGIVEVFAQ
jgi:hypothetical protein